MSVQANARSPIGTCNQSEVFHRKLLKQNHMEVSTCRTSFKNRDKRNYVYNRDMDEEYLTVAAVAEILNISRDTVRRMFDNEPGVLNVGPSHGAGRRYRVLRIPLGVLKRVMSAREVSQAEQAGRTGQ
jgi:hypothetical protein